MVCPHCASSAATTERPNRTELGYRRFRCCDCQREFNEWTGTPFNRLQYPTDVVCLVVLWRFRYKLSLRDLTEMFLQRGIMFTHEAVREWVSSAKNVSQVPVVQAFLGLVGGLNVVAAPSLRPASSRSINRESDENGSRFRSPGPGDASGLWQQ